MNLDSSPNLDSYIAAISSDTAALAAVADAATSTGALGAPVAACPGWDVALLLGHVGAVHRRATAALVLGRSPEATEIAGLDPGDTPVGAWLSDGAERLVAALSAGSPDDETWHPFPAEQRRWVWARRQANETMVHRWDAEAATGAPTPLAPRRAADALAEFFELGVPRILEREGMPAPSASLHVHCTDDGLGDGEGEWIVWGDDGEYRLEATHRKGDAALRGGAGDLLLVMTGRAGRDTVALVGDPAAAEAWLGLPGW